MITKTITYKDFLGNERTEKFSFHFSEAELGEMELTTEGGMGAYIKKITDEKDAKKLAELFKDVIQKSYGKLSEDGRRFKKSPEILEDFVETNAYSKLWLELATNAETASQFIRGLLPSDLEAQIPANVLENL